MFKLKKLLACLLRPTFARGLFVAGVAAGVEHKSLFDQLPALGTVLDIGANSGQFALAVRAYCPSAQVLAFEPLARPAQKFVKVHGRDPKVKLIQAAVGENESALDMHVSARDDSSSLLEITERQVATYPGTEEVASERVRVARLLTLVGRSEIEAPALLKIDVQGYEMQVLKGSSEAIDLFHYIYVECSFVEFYAHQALAPDVTAWLESRGFRLRALLNKSFSGGELVQADHLFVRAQGTV